MRLFSRLAAPFVAVLLGSTLAVAQTPAGGGPGACSCPGGGTNCGPMGMRGGMMRGAGCGMVGQTSDVEVQNTSSGAIIRLTPKSGATVGETQAAAQRLANCLGAQPSPAPKSP